MKDQTKTLPSEELAALRQENETLRRRLAELEAREAELQTETRERVAELTIINSVGEAMAKQLDVQTVTRIVGDKVREIFQAEAIDILLLDPQTDLIRILYSNYRGYHDKETFTFPLGEGLTSRVISSRQPLVLGTLQAQIESGVIFSDELGELDRTESYLAVPIIIGEKVLGVVSVQSYQPHAYDENSVRLLSTLSANMGVAIENARLFEETKRLLAETEQRNAELAIINSVGEGLVKELDFQAIIELVGGKIREILQVEKIFIALYDSQTQLIHYPYYLDRDRRILQEPNALGTGLTSRVIQSRRPLALGTVEQQFELGVIYYPGEELTPSWLGVPIIVSDKVTGVISVQSYEAHAFNDSHVRLLSTLAASMGVALENARLFEAERSQARRQAALFRLSGALAAALDKDAICQALVDGLQDEALGYAYVGIFLVDAATGERILRAAAGPSTAEIGLRLGAGQGLSERPLLDDQLHYTPDVTRAEAYVPSLSSGAEVDVPLKIGSKVIGVLVVESRQPNAFGQDDFDVLTSAATQAGVALGRARLLQETHQRMAELATVNSISQALTAELDLDALIELVGEQVRQTFAADVVYVALLDQQTNLIHFPYTYGDDLTTITLGEGLTSRIIESKQPLLINEDVERRYAELQTAQIGVPVQSYLGVPIMAGSEAIGVISAQSTTQVGRFGEADLKLLNTIAANVGAALQNARLYRETQRRAEEMAALAEIGRDLSATLDLSTVLEQIAAQAQTVLKARDVVLRLLEPDGALPVVVAIGRYPEQLKATPLQLGQGIAGHVAQTGQVEIVNYPLQDPRVVRVPGTEDDEEREAIIFAPLISREKVIGVMILWRDRLISGLFTQDDLDFLVGLAQQAAIAIENARLYRESQRRAEEMAALAEVSRKMTAILDLPALLERIASHSRELLAAANSAIYLLEPDNRSLSLIAGAGDISEAVKNFKLQIGQGIVGSVAESGLPEKVDDILADPRYAYVPGDVAPPGQKLLLAPLFSRQQVIGVMTVRRNSDQPRFNQA
ncbi:MAG: GAF domain-containing protein, partial [Chloroflexi bacterium]|nr:GAF domain-containing protein [Chloroflexota bacterium]